MTAHEKPVYIPLFGRDIFGDKLVRAMSNEQIGAYVKLLWEAWINTPPCTLPDDDAMLCALCDMTPRAWAKNRASILRPWSKTESGDLTQKRLVIEYGKFLEGRSARSDRSRKAAEERWRREREARRASTPHAVQGQCSSMPPRVGLACTSSSGEGVQGERASPPDVPTQVALVLAAYPRQEALDPARPFVERALGEMPFAALLAIVRIFASSKAGRSGRFVPFPAAFFENRRYLDDPEVWARESWARGDPAKPAVDPYEHANAERKRAEAEAGTRAKPDPESRRRIDALKGKRPATASATTEGSASR